MKEAWASYLLALLMGCGLVAGNPGEGGVASASAGLNEEVPLFA